MSFNKIETKNAPSPAGPYSQGITIPLGGAGNLIFVAGTLPLDPESKEIVGTTIEEQTEQVLKNIEAILAEGGASLKNVVKVTVHLDNIGRIGDFNTAYETFFSEPRPVRTTVGSLMGPGIMVEIDVVAKT
jgi:reactive intermediate/imine deaminase